MKHLVRKKVKEAYNQYLEDILNLSNADAQNGHKPNTRKLYSLIKYSKQETSAIPPLKYENKFPHDDVSKATALKRQFQPVFSPKSLLSLASLCKMNPKHNQSLPSMPYIQIRAKGIEKLLNNLNPHKACGPDKIKPIVLNTLSKELSQIL
jgi:hypothetical protein